MSNKLSKEVPKESRHDIMQRVAKKIILLVKDEMARSALTPPEIIAVLEIIADSFTKAVDNNRRAKSAS